MRSRLTLAAVIGGLLVVMRVADAQVGEAEEPAAPGIHGVIAPGTRARMVAAIEGAVNGPVALPDASGVLFCAGCGTTPELAAHTRIMKIDPEGRVSVLLENAGGALSLAFDASGRLIANQTLPPGRTRIAVIHPPGEEAVLADNFQGRPFGRPNDLVVARNGGVYFSDPGPNEAQMQGGHPAADPAVYYIPPGGSVLRVASGIGRPNGIQLNPEETVLYVVDTDGDYLLAFDVRSDGTLGPARRFARVEHGPESAADGLAVDGEGRIYLAARLKDSVQVFGPDGTHLGNIPVSRGPGNLAFGGPGKQTLYLTGGGGIRTIEMLAQGFLGRAK